jgi:hypothetical protein
VAVVVRNVAVVVKNVAVFFKNIKTETILPSADVTLDGQGNP